MFVSKFPSACLIAFSLGTLACASTPQPTPTPAPAPAAAPEIKPVTTAPVGPWSGCEPAVEVTAGFVVKCPERTHVLSRWTQATAVRLLSDVRAQMTRASSKDMTFEPHVVNSLQGQLNGITYTQKKPARFGVIVTVEDTQGRARVGHCMVTDQTQLRGCERDLAELAQKGELPSHLALRGQTPQDELIPRVMGRALSVPSTCAWKGAQVSCEDQSALMWREVNPRDRGAFEAKFTQQVRQGLEQKFGQVDEQLGWCASFGAQVECTRLVAKRFSMVIAPAQFEGKRALLMCSRVGKARAGNPAICTQVLSWTRSRAPKPAPRRRFR